MSQLEVFANYAGIKQQIAELENKLKELEPAMIATLKEVNDKYQAEYGTFSRAVRTSWKYSDELTEKARKMDAAIKSFQTEEQENGTAVKAEKEFVKFLPKKGDK